MVKVRRTGADSYGGRGWNLRGHEHSHDHDSCTPDLDLVVAGIRDPGHAREHHGADVGAPGKAEGWAGDTTSMVGPTSTVEPVFTLTPLNLQAGVIDRSQQVPVVVLIGSPVAPGSCGDPSAVEVDDLVGTLGLGPVVRGDDDRRPGDLLLVHGTVDERDGVRVHGGEGFVE